VVLHIEAAITYS